MKFFQINIEKAKSSYIKSIQFFSLPIIISILCLICPGSCGSEKKEGADIPFEIGKGKFGIDNFQSTKLCISTHIDIYNTENMMRELSLLSELGVKFIRRDFFWAELEPEKDVISEKAKEGYRKLVEEAKKRGIDVIPILAYGTKWSSQKSEECFAECINEGNEENQCISKCDKFLPNPQDYGKFSKWVADNFPEINKFEIWNEPNYIFFLNPNYPEGYAEILRSSSEAIKRARKDADIIFGGITMAETNLPENIIFVWYKFLGAIKSLGAFDYVDSVAYHPYVGPKNFPYPPSLPPEDEKNSAGSLIKLTLGIKRIIPADKKLYITEIGWPSKNTEFVSEEAQARYITKSLILSSMLGVEIMCVYTFQDVDGETYLPHEAEKYFGIVKADFSPKLSFYALKNIAGSIENKIYIGDAITYIDLDGKEIKIENGELDNPEKVKGIPEDGIVIFSPVFRNIDGKEYTLFIWAATKYGEEINTPVEMKIKLKGTLKKVANIYGDEVGKSAIVKIEQKQGVSDVYLSVGSSPVALYAE